MTQQGDVLLYQTDDDGEINVVGGVVEMSGGLETAAYLSMFGGNEDDSGSDGNAASWWGNLDEDTVDQYRSETQHLLQALPATSGNLRKIEDAAGRDLAWFVSEKVASSVEVAASIPALNRVKILIKIEADGEEASFEFTENWKVAA